MKELLVADFFMPEDLIGLRVELKNKETDVSGTTQEVKKKTTETILEI